MSKLVSSLAVCLLLSKTGDMAETPMKRRMLFCQAKWPVTIQFSSLEKKSHIVECYYSNS